MGKNKKIPLTKACRGISFSDVSNNAVRAILSKISNDPLFKEKKISKENLEATENYFDWKCPYTGIDLKDKIFKERKGYSADHIIPQNKDSCGLNIMGNLVYVDSSINIRKRNLNAEDFLLNRGKIKADGSLEERKKRLERIMNFQKDNGYYHEKILLIKKKMNEAYDEISKLLEKYYGDCVKLLK